VLGVQREYGLSNDTKKVLPTDVKEGHFLLADSAGRAPDLGKHVQRIYPCVETATIVAKDNEGSVTIATNNYGKGRGVYLAGFKLGAEQSRLLQRAVWFASGREGEMGKRWFSTNIHTEVAAYPQTRKYIVINSSNEPQTTVVTDGEGREHRIQLAANASKWFNFDGTQI
jgi:1,3-beta-galactosyl-N-acetylhexosamine phosphorylase